MMMFSTKMCRLAAVILAQDVDSVTKELLKQGLLHFVKFSDVTDDAGNQFSAMTLKVPQSKIADTRRRIDAFFTIIDYTPADIKELDVSKLSPISIEKNNADLDELASSLQKLRDNQKNIQQEIHKLEEIKRQLTLFETLDEGFDSNDKYTFLSIITGKIPEAKETDFALEFKTIPSVQIKLVSDKDTVTILLVTMKRDVLRVEKLLAKFEWDSVEYEEGFDHLGFDAKTEVDVKITELKEQQNQVNAFSMELVEEKKEFLDKLWSNLKMNELFYSIQSFFSKTARTMLFSGWLPANKRNSLESAIFEITKGKCYLEWSDPKEIKKDSNKTLDVPVKMKNPKFLSPFEMLVRNYAIPEYGTIDPTPIVAVAYLAMFGLMFGDAGHGLVLVLIGILGIFLKRKEKESGIYKLFQLIIWCGSSAIVTGILFGSYFGQSWFKPLWFDYHGVITGHAGAGYVTDVYGILRITIYFGIAVIGLGLVLNWINCISKRNWFRFFLGNGGLLGGWIYGAGIYTAFYFVAHDYKGLPPSNMLFFLVGLPAILFMIKPPLEFVLHNKAHSSHKAKLTAGTILNFAMEWIVEMLEIFSGYLANTLSFMRVAGLGIAHVSLMIAFDQIADMITGGKGGFNIWAILVLVTGNVLVIGLEGLSAGIQALRLNYFEFFSKYFSGTGKAYAPISLKGNK